MRFRSTRGSSPEVGLGAALIAGLGPDGGLYVPESFPQMGAPARWGKASLQEIGSAILKAFAGDDPLSSQLDGICRRAWDFPVRLRSMSKKPEGLLELFHGPTSAFKDFAARFLAECVAFAPASTGKKRLVLVATSGDTGGAVAAAFYQKADVEVAVLYPKGRISARQEKQLTTWGGNIRAFAVSGSFDDCQKMVKEAFQDPGFQSRFELISANSINIGRILPQTVYYAWASLDYFARVGKAPGFAVPTGNLGNALAAVWAKEMGFPIREIALSLNANRSIADFMASGKWNSAPSVATLANAMDVGNPSNLERLRFLFPEMEVLKKPIRARSFSDDEIRGAIKRARSEWGEMICPHTATAYAYALELGTPDWVVVATAHPAKFEEIVEPLLAEKVPVPRTLAEVLGRPSKKQEIPATTSELLRLLQAPQR